MNSLASAIMRYSMACFAFFGVLPSVHAGINLDLSYIDKKSAEYSRFRAWVDSAAGGADEYGFSAQDAATMARLSGDRKYCAVAVRMTDAQVTRAEAAIASGQAPEVAADSYLYVGQMIADLALTYDWCSAATSPEQRRRWAAYAERTVANVWDPQGAKWNDRPFPWSGWSIDDPGNNYYYSFVEATMYWALASDSARWLALLRDDKLPALQSYFAKLPGGGSLEGTGYGTSHARLFAIYGLWRDATGADLANANSHLTDTIAYWVHATVPTLDRFAPIGDQARVSVPELYDYQRCLMLRARHLTNDAHARAIAAWWLNHISVRQMANGFNYRCDLLPAGPASSPPAQLVYHARGTGQLFARTDWDRDAMWLAVAAGPYVESHAHQDQGAFTLFDGDWLAVTENIWTHSGIQQGPEVGNLVRFVRNGKTIPQRYPSVSSMVLTPPDADSAAVHATLDLTPAYAGSGVRSWRRSIDFAGRKLTVHDTFAASPDIRAIFQVNTPVKPNIHEREASAGKLHIKVLAPADATLSVVDWSSLDRKEFNSGWRIDVQGSGGEFVVELTSMRQDHR